jgi:hypothetical protein
VNLDSAAATPASETTRPALASLFRYSPALILLAIAIADLIRFCDPDLWGHIRFGQAMLREGHIVWRDPYSYSAPGHIWRNHEWLTELIMGALYNHLNVFGLKMMKLGCTALMMIFIVSAEREAGAPTLIQFAILIVASVTIAPQIQFRPQLFTFVLLAALIYLLARDAYGRGAPLWLAVPMLTVWANLHGGFILGIATLALYTAVSAARDIYLRRGLRRSLRLAAITMLAILATLVTPYGFGTWLAVVRALIDPYTRIVIMDWQPLGSTLVRNLGSDLLSASYLELAVLMMAAMLFSFILTPSSDDLPLVVIAAVMSVGAFLAVRNLPVAVIALCAPLARHLPLALERRWPAVRDDPGAARPASRLNQAILATLALMIFWRSDLFSNQLTSIDPYPVSACAFMKDHHLKGNVLGLFGWGEYLIWHFAPDSKVFMDGRYDTVYPRHILEVFFVFNYNQPGAELAITKYPTDYVLIAPNIGARKFMDSRSDWRLIYSDAWSRLYARVGSPAALLPGVPVAGTARQVSFP